MSKNKRIAAFLLTICSTGAIAQSGPMTIQEWTNRQAEIKRAEQEAKLDEQRRKTNVSAPVQIARTCDADIAMFAVYGVGEKLWADFGFRGATVTLAAGEGRDVGGWYVDDLTPSRAMLVKRSGRKVVARCPIYLSTVTQATQASGTPAAGETDVPPIKPLSTETDKAAKPTKAVATQGTGAK